MTRFVLVRHGETDWNAQEKLQGTSDIPLNAVGKLQAQALAESLDDERFDRIISSPLSRALETAQVIAAACGIPETDIVIDPELRERAYGEVEGMTIEERDQAFPGTNAWPGAETKAEINARVKHALSRLAREYAGQHVMLVTHGGWVRAAMRVIAGNRSREAGMVIPNTSRTYIHHDDSGWHIDRVGVQDHIGDIA